MFQIDSTFQTLYDAEVISRYRDKARLMGKTKEKSVSDVNKVQFRVRGYGVATQHVPGKDVATMGAGLTTVELTLSDWDAFDYVDKLETGKNNINDVQELGEIAAVAIGTRSDQIRIDAIANGFDSVNMTVGDDAKTLTMDILSSAQYKLNMKDCPDEDRIFIYHPAALDGLMKDEKFTNNEYLSEKKQLTEIKNGTGRVALGFEFVKIASRPNPNGVVFGLPTRGETACSGFVYHKDAVGYGYNTNISTSIDWIAEKRAWLVGGQLSAAAVVLIQDWICEVKCKIN